MGRVDDNWPAPITEPPVVDLYIEIEKVQQLVKVHYKHDRERSLVMTRLDEASLWLQKCVRQEPASPELLAVEAAE